MSQVALWVMWHHIFNRKKNARQNGNISGPAVSLLIICFRTVHDGSVTLDLVDQTWRPHYPQCNLMCETEFPFTT